MLFQFAPIEEEPPRIRHIRPVKRVIEYNYFIMMFVAGVFLIALFDSLKDS